MALKIKIDRSLCIGCGTCAAVAPKTFELDNEGKAMIKKKDGSLNAGPVDIDQIDDKKENIINAKSSCPVEAISISDT